MAKENKVIIAIAVAMIVTIVVMISLLRGKGQSAERPVVVNSTVQMPDGVGGVLKANTNQQVVVNNTFQMPDNFADTQQKISALQIDMSKRIDGVDYAVGELSRRLDERERQEKQKANEDVEVAREELKADERDAMAALFAINHINWVVTKIKSYNDPAVLEEEYQGLTADALNLRMIKDPELIDLICRILDVITEMRIEEKERDFLKDELDQGMSDALVDAVSSFSVSGISPLSMVVSAITSAASAAMNYRKAKKALQKKFKRQSWALDKNRLYYLNDLNKELLRDFWAIVQKYPGLNDEYRISESDIQLLVDHLKDEDAVKRHEFLVALEKQYAAFQPYWYHRAAAAHEIALGNSSSESEVESAWEDARRSLNMYTKAQVICGNILRKDPMAAKAALLKASVLSHFESNNDEEYRVIIELVQKNSPFVDWQSRYFCAMLAVDRLNDPSLAEEVISPAIAELDWQKRRRLFSYKDELVDRSNGGEHGKVDELLPTGDALYDCRTLIARIGNLSEAEKNRMLDRICKDQSASMRAKVFCYGDMGYKQALEKLRPDLERMRFYKRDDGSCVMSVPFSWVIARDTVMTLVVGEKELQEGGERDIEEREDGKQYVLIPYKGKVDGACPITFQARFDRGAKGEGKKPDKCYMAKVVFSDTGTERKPRKAYFGPWEVAEGATGEAGWRMLKPSVVAIKGSPQSTTRPDYEEIDLYPED